MRGRPKSIHLCKKLSDWECMELYQAYQLGVTKTELRRRYHMSGSTLNQTIRNIEDAGRMMGFRVGGGVSHV
mgnify:CR=1 FL=1